VKSGADYRHSKSGTYMIKAYLLILLISAIAGMSHLDLNRKSAERKA
jgi:hypothetical protein